MALLTFHRYDAMKKINSYPAIRIIASLCIAAMIVWIATATTFRILVEPLIYSKQQNATVLDFLALVQASSITAVVSIFSWLVVILCARRVDILMAAGLGSIVTWIFLSAGFYCVENLIGVDALSSGILGRATEVLAEGSDIIFMPFVIPIIAVFSGVSLFVGLAIPRARRPQSSLRSEP